MAGKRARERPGRARGSGESPWWHPGAFTEPGTGPPSAAGRSPCPADLSRDTSALSRALRTCFWNNHFLASPQRGFLSCRRSTDFSLRPEPLSPEAAPVCSPRCEGGTWGHSHSVPPPPPPSPSSLLLLYLIRSLKQAWKTGIISSTQCSRTGS